MFSSREPNRPREASRYGPVGGGSLQVGIPAGGRSEQVSPGGQTPAHAVACDSIRIACCTGFVKKVVTRYTPSAL
jgi:hypothetical protein